jgi:hypothetical protein
MAARTTAFNAIHHNTGRQKLFNGLTHPGLPSALQSKNFVYVDNGYFDRQNCFRLIRGHVHLTELLDRPGDRWDRLNIKLRPWQTNGRHIVVIPPSEWYVTLFKCADWLFDTRITLEKHTDRPIVVKHGKGGLEQELQDAWAVVTYGSVAGIEAAILGVPVFSGPICPTLPISAGSLEEIETPTYRELRPWLCSLAYANWRVSEIPKIHLEDYRYTCES